MYILFPNRGGAVIRLNKMTKPVCNVLSQRKWAQSTKQIAFGKRPANEIIFGRVN